LERLQIECAWDRLLAHERYQDPRSLIPFGHQVYSQSDEDGIIREIFRRIGATNRIFVEFGVGTGLENNTLALLFEGWSGLWIEGSAEHVRRMRKHLPRILADGRLRLIEARITRDNIDGLIASAIRTGEIDLLSIDLDGNDYHVFRAIRCVRPRVLVIEYNARFPPSVDFCMPYDDNHVWDRTDRFGASLTFLETGLAESGYRLVGCNLTGANAFFVREDLVANRFHEPLTAEHHYEPARYDLAGRQAGHSPSYETVEALVAQT
jgi:hypothetical protein